MVMPRQLIGNLKFFETCEFTFYIYKTQGET